MGDCRLGGLLGTSTPPWSAQASRNRVQKKEVLQTSSWHPSGLLRRLSVSVLTIQGFPTELFWGSLWGSMCKTQNCAPV